MAGSPNGSASASVIHDVVIAGAGPVGLFLACELGLAGVSVLVLEQNIEGSNPLKRLPFGIRGLSVPTLEAFHRRGMLNELLEKTARPKWMMQVQQQQRPGGHFAGIQYFLDDVNTEKWNQRRLPSPVTTSVGVELEHVEAVLTSRAAALGVEIRRGVGVEGFDQSSEEVRVRTDESQTIRGRWLVGCDGGRSKVRKAGGFEFVGTDPEVTGYSVEAEIADPEKLRLGLNYTPKGAYTFAQPGTIVLLDFDGGASHRIQPTLEHIQEVVRRISGTDVTLIALKVVTTWTDRAFQATEYRKGRVLLAGDAAHIHSPLGGQGLNLGIGDAINLGWKLAAMIRGEAPDGLLDSYSGERHPVAAQILDWSRAQIGVMRPARSSRALEAIFRDIMNTRDGATYFAERVWGMSLHYDLGSSHLLVGYSAPEFELLDGRKLGELLRNGYGLFLDFDGRQSLQELVSRWKGRIVYVASDVKDRLGSSAVLVRPDGFVAWASDGTSTNEEDAAQAASRWFGLNQ